MKHNFEKLHIWQDAIELCLEINEAIANSKNFGLKDQLLRSSISVASNIAEGCERQSEKDFLRYLNISAGSAGEVRTQLIISVKINELDEAKGYYLIDKYRRLSSQIFAFMNTIRANSKS